MSVTICSHKTCKAPVKSSPPTYQNATFLQAGYPMSLNQHVSEQYTTFTANKCNIFFKAETMQQQIITITKFFHNDVHQRSLQMTLKLITLWRCRATDIAYAPFSLNAFTIRARIFFCFKVRRNNFTCFWNLSTVKCDANRLEIGQDLAEVSSKFTVKSLRIFSVLSLETSVSPPQKMFAVWFARSLGSLMQGKMYLTFSCQL